MAVDDLFDGPAPAPRPDPRRALNRWLVFSAALTLSGPFCCTGPAAAFAAIYTWVRAGDELVRAEAGVIAPEAAATAQSVRRGAFGLMVTSLFTLTLQMVFFGVYVSAARWAAETFLPPLLELYMRLTAPG